MFLIFNYLNYFFNSRIVCCMNFEFRDTSENDPYIPKHYKISLKAVHQCSFNKASMIRHVKYLPISPVSRLPTITCHVTDKWRIGTGNSQPPAGPFVPVVHNINLEVTCRSHFRIRLVVSNLSSG